MTTLLESPALLIGMKKDHWTVKEFYQAADAGAFDAPGRLELIHGRIVEKMPISPLHADTADYFAECLRAILSPRFKVREEKPIHIAFDGEPVPDICIVEAQRYGQQHPIPEEVALIVEIAVTSAEYDLGEKALLYAQANILEYWVALPELSQMVVHRGPTAEGYISVSRLDTEASIAPLAAPDALFTVSDLFGRTKENHA